MIAFRKYLLLIATATVTTLLSGCGQDTPPASSERTPALAVSIVVEVEIFDPEEPQETEKAPVVADASAADPLPAGPGPSITGENPIPGEMTAVAEIPADAASPDFGDRDRTFFAFDNAAVREDQLATVREWGDWLKAHPGWALRIEGHTDRQGPCGYNRQLGQQRANAARNILLEQGVNASRLLAVSFGEDRPAIPDAARAERSQNRRVRAEPMRLAELQSYDPDLAPCALADGAPPETAKSPAGGAAPPSNGEGREGLEYRRRREEAFATTAIVPRRPEIATR